MFKITPGPWLARTGKANTSVYVAGTGHAVAVGCTEADGNAIATLPMLLNTLSKIDRWITDEQIRGRQTTLTDQIRTEVRVVLNFVQGPEDEGKEMTVDEETMLSILKRAKGFMNCLATDEQLSAVFTGHEGFTDTGRSVLKGIQSVIKELERKKKVNA